MVVIFKSRNTFDVVQYEGVKNIAFSADVYTITKSDNTTVSYSKGSYLIFVFE